MPLMVFVLLHLRNFFHTCGDISCVKHLSWPSRGGSHMVSILHVFNEIQATWKARLQ